MLHWAHAYDTDHSETPFLINSKSGSSCCWELHLQSEEKKTSYALATRTEASATDELESKCISSICRLSRDGLAPVVSSWVLRCCPASQQGSKMKERVIWPTERGNGETWQQMGALIELYSTDGSTACRSFLWVSMKRTVLRKHEVLSNMAQQEISQDASWKERPGGETINNQCWHMPVMTWSKKKKWDSEMKPAEKHSLRVSVTLLFLQTS